MNLSRNGGAEQKIPASVSLPRAIRWRAVALVLVLELAAALAAELVATVAEELVDRARAKVPAREFAGDLLDDATDKPGAEPELVWLAKPCPGCSDTYVDLDSHLAENVKGCRELAERIAAD